MSTDAGDGGTTSHAYTQVFDADGNAAGGAQPVDDDYDALSQQAPAITAIYGGYVAVWQAYNTDDSAFDVFSRTFDDDGNPTSCTVQVNTTGALFPANPSVAITLDGGYIVVWQGGTDSNKAIYSQRYDSCGCPDGGETLVDDGFGRPYQSGPVVSVLADGGYVRCLGDR
ncbi:MAG: hypothetical protein WDN06_15055 [Asticcacaulis sp.]